MPNSSSANGQVQRAGVQRLITDKRGKRRKIKASKIRESYRHSFIEQGKDEQAKGKKKNRVYLVTVIEEGLGNSKDKNFYSKEALQSGVKVFNGAKAYCDHPDAITEKTLPERSMRDVVGWYSDCFVDNNPKTGKTRLRGKLHFFPDAKWLTDKIDTILTDPSAKNLFGISINAIGKTRPATMGGEEVNYVEEFQRVDSADVVTEPAARGKFDQMLESRRSVAGSGSVKVNNGMKVKRAREAGVLSPEKAKEVADSLVSAYNSDNPDETKQAAFDAAKVLHAASSISGKGSGQPNEEQYSNITPNGGGSDQMSRKATKMKASAGKRSFRKGKRLQAAAGTGRDSEDVDEPDEGDIEDRLHEADVEDKEGRGDLGDQSEFGGGSKYRKVKASAEESDDIEESDDLEEGLEDEGIEGLEDEDEGFEDEGMEDEDEDGMGGGGMPPGAGAPPQAAGGGGAPGSSKMVAAADGDDDDDFGDDEEDMDDMDEADESEFEMHRPGVVAEAGPRRRAARFSRRPSGGRRRAHEAKFGGNSGQGGTKASASFAGGLGHSGHTTLPKGADPTRDYDHDSDEGWGKEDSSTSGVGKSYKLKTSRFARNRKAARVVKPVVREANRRIEFLTEELSRLRESNRSKDQKINRYRGKMRFIEAQRSANKVLREAVAKDILPESVADTLYPNLIRMASRSDQVQEVKRMAHVLEAATEGTLSRLSESVEGSGARGGFASRGTAGADSELAEGMAGEGIPMMEEEE